MAGRLIGDDSGHLKEKNVAPAVDDPKICKNHPAGELAGGLAESN